MEKNPAPAPVASITDMVCRAVTKHVPDAIGFSPIIRFTVRLIAQGSASAILHRDAASDPHRALQRGEIGDFAAAGPLSEVAFA